MKLCSTVDDFLASSTCDPREPSFGFQAKECRFWFTGLVVNFEHKLSVDIALMSLVSSLFTLMARWIFSVQILNHWVQFNSRAFTGSSGATCAFPTCSPLVLFKATQFIFCWVFFICWNLISRLIQEKRLWWTAAKGHFFLTRQRFTICFQTKGEFCFEEGCNIGVQLAINNIFSWTGLGADLIDSTHQAKLQQHWVSASLPLTYASVQSSPLIARQSMLWQTCHTSPPPFCESGLLSLPLLYYWKMRV